MARIFRGHTAARTTETDAEVDRKETVNVVAACPEPPCAGKGRTAPRG